jgi:hypothetical protein
MLAEALEYVRPVDSRGMHTDEHFLAARLGHSAFDRPQYLRSANAVDLDSYHVNTPSVPKHELVEPC